MTGQMAQPVSQPRRRMQLYRSTPGGPCNAYPAPETRIVHEAPALTILPSTNSTYTIPTMDVLPEDIQALLSKVLPKVLFAIDALTSLRDVPVILEYVALRLAFLEYAMCVWRRRQSPNIRGKPQSLCIFKPAYLSSLANISRLICKMAVPIL